MGIEEEMAEIKGVRRSRKKVSILDELNKQGQHYSLLIPSETF